MRGRVWYDLEKRGVAKMNLKSPFDANGTLY